MSSTAAPPSNFGSGGTSTPRASIPFSTILGIADRTQNGGPGRRYVQNPFAAQTPPPGPLPPGLSAGPPNGMTPEQWHQYRYQTDKQRKNSARAQLLIEAIRRRRR